MARFLMIALLVAAIAAGVYVGMNYEIHRETVNGKTAWRIAPRNAGPSTKPVDGGATPLDPTRKTIRIASFHLGRFDELKLADPRVSDVLVKLIPNFDIIAVQGVRGRNRGVLIQLIQKINEGGRNYDFLTSPAQQRDGIEHYGAFLFNRATVETDSAMVGFVDDKLGRFRVRPLVGWFRARGPSPDQAFTFWLMNVENDIDPAQTTLELDLLAEAYRALRDKPPQEDDVILLGDLERDDKHLGKLGNLLGVAPLLSDVTTSTRGAQQLDNILLDRRTTCEFTGLVKVVDMVRAFNLTTADALEVSGHLPIWAEFSIYEGNQNVPLP